MFQNKTLKRNPTFTIVEVVEVALCDSNCALPPLLFCHKKSLIKIYDHKKIEKVQPFSNFCKGHIT